MPTKINLVGTSLTDCMLVRTFTCIKQKIDGKRESVSWLHSMEIDEQCEYCLYVCTLCATKSKGTYRLGEGTIPVTTLVQKISEGKTSYELGSFLSESFFSNISTFFSRNFSIFLTFLVFFSKYVKFNDLDFSASGEFHE